MQRYNNTINLAHFEDERDCQNKRLSCEKLRYPSFVYVGLNVCNRRKFFYRY